MGRNAKKRREAKERAKWERRLAASSAESFNVVQQDPRDGGLQPRAKHVRLDFSNGNLIKLDQDFTPFDQSILPVFVSFGGRRAPEPWGTAFVIGLSGFAITAKHLFDRDLIVRDFPDARNGYEVVVDYLDPFGFGASPAGFGEIGKALSIAERWDHPDWDVTVVRLAHSGADNAARPALYPLRLAAGLPEVGLRLIAFGFPRNRFAPMPGHEGESGLHLYERRLYASRGWVRAVYERGGAPSIVRGPCLRFDGYLPPGMSGGPVVDSRGAVIGFVSAGGEDIHGRSVSWVTLVGAALATEVDREPWEGKTRALPLALRLSPEETSGLQQNERMHRVLSMEYVGARDAWQPHWEHYPEQSNRLGASWANYWQGQRDAIKSSD